MLSEIQSKTKEKHPKPKFQVFAYRGQLNISELARMCSLRRTTFYKYIELLET